jgi:tRNA-dihydrouridine synthase B
LDHPLILDDLELPSIIAYSPLVGCSDFPFRKMAARYKPALMFCEMVHMGGLIRKKEAVLKTLAYSEEMRPIGAQICGSDPTIAGEAAKIIEDLGFDVVDLNCGCPVDNVTKDGSGSGMLKNPELIGEILAEMKKAVKIPVTLKVRAGWDENSIVAPLVTEIAEERGAAAIFVHGRTRSQAYRGPAKWKYIKACKERAKKIKVFGNGDLFHATDAPRMIEETGCDGVLVSRGTMGQPWIAEDIRAVFAGRTPKERNFDLYRDALIAHLEHVKEFRGEMEGVLDMRRISCWYFKNFHNARHFRSYASKAASFEEVKELIKRYTPVRDDEGSPSDL